MMKGFLWLIGANIVLLSSMTLRFQERLLRNSSSASMFLRADTVTSLEHISPPLRTPSRNSSSTSQRHVVTYLEQDDLSLDKQPRINSKKAVPHRSSLHSSSLSKVKDNSSMWSPETSSFPRWSADEGVPLKTLLDFVESGERTNDHTKDVNGWFPETLYVVDKSGLWGSGQHRKKINRNIPLAKGSVNRKLAPTEDLAKKATEMLKEETDPHFRRLREVVFGGAGFPFLAFYGDYTGCNYKNWQNKHSIPLFTTAANVQCQHTFPWPTYQTVKDSRHTATEWETVQKQWQEQYPWENKISKVFWRGSITGHMDDKGLRSLRWQMLKQVKDLSTTNTSYPANLFDVGATRLPRRWEMLHLDLEEVGGIVDGISPMSKFMRYKVALDVDGNSWSSRFGALLCYNSVVLKVVPRWVDYFYYKESDPLLPWKHYVPVEADLSDLVEQAAYVTNPANDDQMRNIVAKANAWCQRNMVESVLMKDILLIWKNYIEKLDQADLDWQKTWIQAKDSVFSSQLEMTRL